MRKLILVFLAVWLLLGVPLCAAPGSNLLRVHFVDVGQGDAIWIQGPAGEGSDSDVNIIIDGGPHRGTDNRLLTYLAKYGVPPDSVIDYLILTHPHEDHYPGLIDILDKYQVKTIIDSGFPKTGPKFRKFLDAAQNEKFNGKAAEFVQLRKQPGFQMKLDGELHAKIVTADSAGATGLGSDNTRENNASIVVRLAYRNISFLFMGDAEGKDREETPDKSHFAEPIVLAKLNPDLHATVLKAAHHGSETGSTTKLIHDVSPEVVVIMSGRKKFRTRFLPDDSVIKRFQTELPGVVVMRTDQDDEKQGLTTTNDFDGDDILAFTDGDSLEVHQARLSGNKRKWVKIKTISHGEER